MEKTAQTAISFDKEFLNKLAEDGNSCVEIQKGVKRLPLHPFRLVDIHASVRDLLQKRIARYDDRLNGILLGYRQPRALETDPATFDGAFTHFDVEAEFYVFRPAVGRVLAGVVNKRSKDHVGCLVYGAFNVSLPRPRDADGWPGRKAQIGADVRFRITFTDLDSKLPYIRGEIVSLVSDDSGFSTEGGSPPQNTILKFDDSDEDESNPIIESEGTEEVINPTKKKRKRQSSEVPTNPDDGFAKPSKESKKSKQDAQKYEEDEDESFETTKQHKKKKHKRFKSDLTVETEEWPSKKSPKTKCELEEVASLTKQQKKCNSKKRDVSLPEEYLDENKSEAKSRQSKEDPKKGSFEPVLQHKKKSDLCIPEQTEKLLRKSSNKEYDLEEECVRLPTEQRKKCKSKKRDVSLPEENIHENKEYEMEVNNGGENFVTATRHKKKKHKHFKSDLFLPEETRGKSSGKFSNKECESEEECTGSPIEQRKKCKSKKCDVSRPEEEYKSVEKLSTRKSEKVKEVEEKGPDHKKGKPKKRGVFLPEECVDENEFLENLSMMYYKKYKSEKSEVKQEIPKSPIDHHKRSKSKKRDVFPADENGLSKNMAKHLKKRKPNTSGVSPQQNDVDKNVLLEEVPKHLKKHDQRYQEEECSDQNNLLLEKKRLLKEVSYGSHELVQKKKHKSKKHEMSVEEDCGDKEISCAKQKKHKRKSRENDQYDPAAEIHQYECTRKVKKHKKKKQKDVQDD